MIKHKKYVIINGKPIVFDSDLLHADVVSGNTRIESAGFVTFWENIDGVKIICSGESTSLSISSRPGLDEVLIAKYLSLNHE